MQIVKLLLASCLLLICSQSFADMSQRKSVQQFISQMVSKHKFKKAELEKWFKAISVNDTILKTMKKPAESKPWYEYQRLFITPDRIAKGVKFIQAHKAVLDRAQKKYDVPASIITAIIGVETHYGQRTGNFKVMEALATLAFAYPKRSKFFRKELIEYLLLTRAEKIDPLSLTGSYAGAIGIPQFMPSSYRAYAVDFTGNGKRNLRSNVADAIGSVANYFKVHGWQAGGKVVVPASVSGNKFKKLLILKVAAKPRFKAGQLEHFGVKPEAKLSSKSKVMLFELQGKKKPEYWLGLNNFYVITRYNTSKLYAMAVNELAEKIQQKLAANTKKKSKAS